MRCMYVFIFASRIKPWLHIDTAGYRAPSASSRVDKYFDRRIISAGILVRVDKYFDLRIISYFA